MNSANNSCSFSDSSLKKAAVLIPLLYKDSEWNLLFTRRTDVVDTHKGQVSFPGGSKDKRDASVFDTALREANEEIGLTKSNVDIVGCLENFPTISNFVIKPVIGVIKNHFNYKLSPLEVSRVFYIPISWLANPNHFEERAFTLSNGDSRTTVFYQIYDNELLWGISAQITINFLERLNLL
jgi:8-oxo-dGTP pyrophosphatase MutT (NUDIX family)